MSKEPLGTEGNNGDEPIRWVTPKEAEKFVSMVGRTYVRRFGKDDKIPDNQDPKEYVYKIIHVNPYTRISHPDEGPTKFLMQFQVQKCYRNKSRKVKSDPKSDLVSEIKLEVRGHEADGMGTLHLVDPDAFKSVDAFDFDKQYIPDNQ
jgi:hypothetical protein